MLRLSYLLPSLAPTSDPLELGPTRLANKFVVLALQRKWQVITPLESTLAKVYENKRP